MKLSSEPPESYLFDEGKKLYDAGRLPEAIDIWERLFRDGLYGPCAYVLVARCHKKTGGLEKAENLLKEFLSKHPNSPYRDLAREELVQVLCAQGKAEAEPMLVSMLGRARNEAKPAILQRLARLNRAGGNNEKAAQHYKKLFLQYPASVEGLSAADELARMVFLGKLAAPDFSDSEHRARAGKLFEKGRFDLAAHTYRVLLKKRPDDAHLELKLAHCLFKDRQNREAQKLLAKLLAGKLAPDDRMEALRILSLLYWRIDRDKEFEETCRTIIETGAQKYKRKALFNMAVHSMEMRRFDKAEEHFDKLLKSGPSDSTTVDVRWKLAWIKFTKKDYPKAAEAFRQARNGPAGGKIENPAKYWEARSLLLCNRGDEGERLLADVIKKAPLDYYGMQAMNVLKQRGTRVARQEAAAQALRDLSLSTIDKSNKLVSDAEKLWEKGLHEFALLNLNALDESMKSSPGIALLRAKAAHASEQYGQAFDIMSANFGGVMANPPDDVPAALVELAYPKVYPEETERLSQKNAVDPYLVWAVIRQESKYDASAVSPAGALGLMQVTPEAAGLIKKKGSVPPDAIASILDPKQNLAAGVKILAKNLRTFKGKLVPSVAAYNADIRKVTQWVRSNGKMEQDEFIENIPYLETRMYVKKVLAGYQAYTLLHRQKDLAGFW
jgi:soluble lytic murein transglycosylase